MVQTANQQETIQSLKQKIASIYEYLSEQHDPIQANKVKQLAHKLENREFLIAFCGHFSAGKSTMINQVVGEKLLPSSPIPTSANLVKVKSGEDYAKVFFKNDKPRLYLAPYDYEIVKNFCKDGDKIEELEISHSDSRLPSNTVIMDTPGIDSADDAHRIATESAIHLADLIFYVMDYNHVQAELNFLFTKELSEAGKDVYLVINQIDKHKDEELSFSDFQKSVVNSFASWGVKPPRIFYTSLKHKDHPYNEFQQLQAFIAEKLAAKDQLLVPSILHSLRKIAQDHVNQANKIEGEKLTTTFEILDELTEQEKQDLTASYQKLSSTLHMIKEGSMHKEQEFDHSIAQIMKNAYLLPFQTRELAESYLEACQPEFKVGFMFTKQKTLEEKNKRLDSFYQDLLEKTKLQLEWHLREFLLKTLKETELNHGELQSLAQSYSIPVPIDIVTNTVKPGARVTGDYVLHYTEDVANEIKRIGRNQLVEIKASFFEALKSQTAKLKEQYEKEFSKIERYVKALEELNKYEQTIFLREKTIDDLFIQSNIPLKDDVYKLFEIEDEEFEVINSMGETNPIKQEPKKADKISKSPNGIEKKSMEIGHGEGRLKNTTKRLLHASELIKPLPGFQKLAKELTDKADRLENKGFTVALFGAFSAGKSSFANALMGEKVLPVSPNPTTAAINKIKPVSAEHPHGTVLVKFKDKDIMLEDVNRALKVFDLHAGDFAAAAKMIDQITLEKGQEGVLEKTHFAFLQAFKRGNTAFVPVLGTLLETDLDDFQEFVAKEEKSCYVEWIELYYDCELTQKGITLVDTPGADSINARHTGVAFDYIKNSDAILFVTYYNHAFSKADREFLIQLGRVKESFQMDKMFFIINAIDLAENDEEQETVSDYVAEQLMKYGIRNPHLYPVSSLLAIKEKLNVTPAVNSGMGQFEEKFYHFISNDLTEMSISAAERELSRVNELVGKLIQSSNEDQSVKEQKRTEMEMQKAQIKALIEKQTAETMQKRLQMEAEELVFYIKQRVFLRFGDFFKEAFNPSTLRDDGRNLKKALQTALDEFLESLGYDFAQEMRATTVRLDRFMGRLLMDYQIGLHRNLLEINQDLSFSAFEKSESMEINFSSAFIDIDQQIFAKAMSYFKNPRSFFEKNEKKLMSDELNHILSGLADSYLKQESGRLNTHYATELNSEFACLVTQTSEEAADFYLSLLSALEGGVSIELLTGIQQRLLEELDN
ncbi:dynamin family protein [Neobacillus bataviensis LMG 21833]|uniref:Dynamin family protein n=1 Tax=Neobacillus bataviensis LMG 21833 TaxID=1117379 RepID=K6DMJ8_9BACI|nr:dynamin family protein [Neobacillus bataviensis]EKN69539.1 dynamin family protein [Neobacillus bataviensis LMG 21833]